MNLRLTQVQNVRLVPQYQYSLYRQPAGYPNIQKVITPTPKPGYPYDMTVSTRSTVVREAARLEGTGIIISTYV